MKPMLSVRSLVYDVRVDRNQRTALRFPDLDVYPGQLLAVVGASYSGKTTLMSLIAGLLGPREGAIHRDPPDLGLWGSMTFVPQALLLIPELSVLENIALGARELFASLNGSFRGNLDPLVETLNLDRLLARRIDELSVGERQRVMVARAAVCQPRLLIADEPVAHQDAAHAARIIEVLRRPPSHGGACVLFTRNDAIAHQADAIVELAPPHD